MSVVDTAIEEAPAFTRRRQLLPLTGLLKSSRKRLRAVETALRESAKWSEALRAPILPPALYRGFDYGISGRAFDYWLRAFLAVGYTVREEPTVVERLTFNPQDLEGATAINDDGREVSLKSALDGIVQDRREAIWSRKIGSAAFFENCIMHGMMEGIYRDGTFPEPSCPTELMVRDLRALAQVVIDKRSLFSGKSVDLNPKFYHEVFAADADFSIGDRLVELKTTKVLIPPLAFSQVLCYVLIEAWQRGFGLDQLRYAQIAVYSARYGALGVVNLKQVEPNIIDAWNFLADAVQHYETTVDETWQTVIDNESAPSMERVEALQRT